MHVDVNYSIDNPAALNTPIVFVHGVGDSMAGWSSIVSGLPQDRPLVRYDLRGHGRSPGPPGPYGISNFVSDHVRLLADLHFERVDLVGFSLGGLIAQAVAARYPKTIRRLVVIGSVAGRTEDDRQRVKARLELLRQKGPTEIARCSVERWFSPGYLEKHPETYETVVARTKRLNVAAYLAAYEVLATTDLVDDLPLITASTLAITGAHDVGSPPRMSRTIAALVPNGRASIIESARHSVLVEAPHRIAREVKDFVYRK